MNGHNWEEVLSNIDKEEWQKALDILEDKKILTDEDGTFIAKIMLKKSSTLLINFFHRNGYVGNLKITGKYYDFHGEVMALYDEDYFDENDEVISYLDEYVNNKRDMY